MNDTVWMRYFNSSIVLEARLTEDTKHIQNLVTGQKRNTKSGKFLIII